MLSILSAKTSKSLKTLIFQHIRADLEAGKQLVLIVPAQASLNMEKEAFRALGKDGFFSLRILRGQKLAEDILSSTSRPKELAVNTIGRQMLLRNIASRNLEEFGTFKAVSLDKDFLGLAADFIVQLKQNSPNPNILAELTSQTNGILSGKLSDMEILFDGYQKAMEGKFTDSEDMVLFTAQKAKDSKLVKESSFYYYGFYSFTNREIELLKAIENSSLGLNIALLIGDGPQFNVTKDTKKKLEKAFGQANTITAKENGPEAAHPYTKIVCCANPYNQALTIAADIKRQVRENGLSYGDISVLLGGSEEMVGSLKRVFNEYEIPYFADEKKSVMHSSAIEALSSALDSICDDFMTSDITRFVKSGVLDIDAESIEGFEKYLKLYHIKEDKFLTPFKYGKEKLKEKFDVYEEIRSKASSLLKPFKDDFDSKADVKAKAAVLYDFMSTKLDLARRLEELAKKQEENGFVDSSSESLQVYDCLVDLLDQMVLLMGDEQLTSEEFSKIFLGALSDIKVGVLPQAEGKVSLGSISRSQLEETKALYIAGFNDSIIPSKNDPNGILTPAEIQTLKDKGIVISKDSDNLADEELFCIYKALDAATDYLWLGYCISSSSGEELKASPLLLDIKKANNIEEEKDILNQDNELNFVEGKKLSLSRMSEALRAGLGGEKLDSIWKQSYNIIKGNDENSTNVIKAGLTYSNKKAALGAEYAEKLFTKAGSYSLSPSRMDKFAACPFKHFVSYGLRPEEDKEFGMNAPEIGTVYHEALLRLCEKLSEKAKANNLPMTDPSSTWMTASDEEVEKMIDEILSSMENEELDGVMTSTKESIYTSQRVKKTCTKFAKHMVGQVRSEVIDDMFFESGFGRRGSFPAIELSTKDGKVFIEGRIDRVDVTKKEDGTYVRVIDYKSGNTKFNKNLIEKGLSLQLMVYLVSASSNYEKSKDGGIYYLNIKDAYAGANLDDFSKEEIAEEVLEKINKEYKLNGMEVTTEFKEEFINKLKLLCEQLTQGYIQAEPKRIKNAFNSCDYCPYAAICQKEIY